MLASHAEPMPSASPIGGFLNALWPRARGFAIAVAELLLRARSCGWAAMPWRCDSRRLGCRWSAWAVATTHPGGRFTRALERARYVSIHRTTETSQWWIRTVRPEAAGLCPTAISRATEGRIATGEVPKKRHLEAACLQRFSQFKPRIQAVRDAISARGLTANDEPFGFQRGPFVDDVNTLDAR